MPGKRPIVLIVGMHRSGTSLCANIMNVLGLSLGTDLITGKQDNPDGFWEHRRIVEITRKLVDVLKRHIGSRTGVLPYPRGWWRLPEVAPLKRDLIAVLEQELSENRGLWGFKDPRTLSLLPLWKQIFAELNLAPKYVLCLRNPPAVARSLLKRDGLSIVNGELLWLQSMMDGILNTGARFDCIIHYEKWFENPRSQAQALLDHFGLEWPADEQELEATLDSIIKPYLDHSGQKGRIRSRLVATTYGLLSNFSGPTDRPALISLARDFVDSQGTFEYWVFCIEALSANNAALAEDIEKEKKWNRELAAEKQQSDAMCVQLRTSVVEEQRKRVELNSALESAENASRKQVQERDRKITELATSLEKAEKASVQQIEERERKVGELTGALEVSEKALATQLGERDRKITELATSLEKAEKASAQQIEERERKIGELATSLEKAEKASAQQIEERERKIGELTGALEVSEKALATQLEERDREINELTSALKAAQKSVATMASAIDRVEHLLACRQALAEATSQGRFRKMLRMPENLLAFGKKW